MKLKRLLYLPRFLTTSMKKNKDHGLLRKTSDHNLSNNSHHDGIGKPSLYHALVVIFLEFFAWGLLTVPTLTVLKQTFPSDTFLMNGLIQGVKGLLSFLSAPLVGAMSDIWGRKPFLLLTVTFTCCPIPLMTISPWWYFTLLSFSGLFAVTFSVIFAYVADVTTEDDRSAAYGLVSASFAASLVTSPMIGAHLSELYSDNLVIALASAIAILDILFVLVAVPESLPEQYASKKELTWDKADPFAGLRRVGHDKFLVVLCITVFLSYLPEAGQYSCLVVYLKLIFGFSQDEVAAFVAFIGILAVFSQTVVMSLVIKCIGSKHTIVVGLICEAIQLAWYGFGYQPWMMWMCAIIAALSSMVYPAISSYASQYSDPDQQGVSQGVITGIRGLCNGLGPAMFGLIFHVFKINLSEDDDDLKFKNETMHDAPPDYVLPGAPFAFGSVMVMLAVLVAMFLEPPKIRSLKERYRRSSGRWEDSADDSDVT